MKILIPIIFIPILFFITWDHVIGQHTPLEFTSSNLPIIVINTDVHRIPDEPKVAAFLGIINNPGGKRNYITDHFSDYNGRIGIEVRGHSTQKFPKKSYGFETRDEHGNNLNVSLLGMPEENDWVLYAPYSDKSLLRNVLAFYLGRTMGHYASRTRFCELILNGDYQGVYVLMEKIKRDKNRINIAKLNPDEIVGDDLTGGYIIKVDPIEDHSSGWYSGVNPPDSSWIPVFFQYYYPKPYDITTEQKSYVQNFIHEFELSLNDSNFSHPEFGYKKYIAVNSFIDYLIINEFTKNIDAYRNSVFMFKDKDSKGGKLTAGPIWDFNLGFGNYNMQGGRELYTEGWMYRQTGKRLYWWARMMRDNDFKNMVATRWYELRNGSFHSDSIDIFLENSKSYLEEAQQRNFQKWQILGEYVWPNNFVGQTYQQEFDYLKNWITKRLIWMDTNISQIGEPDHTENDNNEANLNSYKIEAFPNPFFSNTTICYRLNSQSNVSLKIYNILGQEIKTLLSRNQTANEYAIKWDGTDDLGNIVANGIYFYVLQVNWEIQETNKLLKLY